MLVTRSKRINVRNMVETVWHFVGITSSSSILNFPFFLLVSCVQGSVPGLALFFSSIPLATFFFFLRGGYFFCLNKLLFLSLFPCSHSVTS